MTKKELKKLKDKLPSGYRDTLATQTDLSLTSVDKILAGERKNINLVKAALNLAKTHQAELAQISSDIKKL